MLYDPIPWKKFNKNTSFNCVQGLVNCSGILNLLPTATSLEKERKRRNALPTSSIQLGHEQHPKWHFVPYVISCQEMLSSESLHPQTKLAKTTQSWTIPQHNFCKLKVCFRCPLQLSSNQQAVPVVNRNLFKSAGRAGVVTLYMLVLFCSLE